MNSADLPGESDSSGSNGSVLQNNVKAVRAIASAVEGTIGTKGLDTMLVGPQGEVLVTNDGLTILSSMEVSHPIAQMVINVVGAQNEEVGDGTTTAVLIAGALLSEAYNHAVRGVPVVRIIDGVRVGIGAACEELENHVRKLDGLEDPLLQRAAYVAAREHGDVAELVVQAARLLGPTRLMDPSFEFSDVIRAARGATSRVFEGVAVHGEPATDELPAEINDCRVLIMDDALEPEEIQDEALATEAGFSHYMELQGSFGAALEHLVELEVGLVLVRQGVAQAAEEKLADSGVMVLSEVPQCELGRAAKLTGGRPLKRTTLCRNESSLLKHLGTAQTVRYDTELGGVQLLGGKGEPTATVVVGAPTIEAAGEKKRIAADAASAVEAAVQGGVVPGGGAVELAISRVLAAEKDKLGGSASYGVTCVAEALKKPFLQIVDNAGYDSLVKLGDVMTAQNTEENSALGIDCETGEMKDMYELGIVDPAPVKSYALKTAGVIAEAVLRIGSIVKLSDD